MTCHWPGSSAVWRQSLSAFVCLARSSGTERRCCFSYWCPSSCAERKRKSKCHKVHKRHLLFFTDFFQNSRPWHFVIKSEGNWEFKTQTWHCEVAEKAHTSLLLGTGPIHSIFIFYTTCFFNKIKQAQTQTWLKAHIWARIQTKIFCTYCFMNTVAVKDVEMHRNETAAILNK